MNRHHPAGAVALALVALASALIIRGSAGADPSPQQDDSLGVPAATATPGGGPMIINVTPGPASVGRYEKYEVSFSITNTTATHFDFPFDPAPPPGLPPATGISVEGLFSNDNWASSLAQPAFLYHPFARSVINGYEHLTPAGPPVWLVRFAPPALGTWRYKLRATDASGSRTYPPTGDLSFSVTPSSSHGFIRVSPTDSRYFQFDDGTPFIPLGYNEGVSGGAMTVDADTKFPLFQANGMNFFRMWLSGTSVVGASWLPWTSHHIGWNGYLPYTSLSIDTAYAGQDFSMKLDDANPCMFQGSYNRAISIQPNTPYRLRARIKTVGLTGPAQAGYPYGFVLKVGGWLDTDCDKPWTGTPLTPYRNGTSDWSILTGSYTSGAGEYFLPNLYLARVNATGGAAYIDQVWLEEDLGGGRYGPNLIAKPSMNPHTYFDPYTSWDWDYVLDRAAAYGVYLKLTVLEKNDWAYTRIRPDGTLTDAWDVNNFYAAPNTKVRWLHQAFWRYLAARWGYSTAVHSWELLNEGDPYSGNHYDQAQAFGAYLHANEPSRHLVTTSTWHSFPASEFWANPAYPDLDCADVHASISTGEGGLGADTRC